MEHTGKITVNVGDIVHGTVHFRSEEVVKVVGKVIRKTDDRLILHLDIRIPLPIIMAEQRFLIQKYKTLTLAQ